MTIRLIFNAPRFVTHYHLWLDGKHTEVFSDEIAFPAADIILAHYVYWYLKEL